MESTDQQPTSTEPTSTLPLQPPKTNKTKGLLLVLLALVLLVATTYGVYAWQQRKVSDLDTRVGDLQGRLDTLSKSNDTSKASAANTGVVQPDSVTTTNELTIKEWGVKVKLRDITKVTYTYSGTGGDEFYIGNYEASVTPVMKAEFLKDKDCKVGISMFRSKEKSDTFTQKKIGDYYYWVTGGPGACSNNPGTNPDDQLKSRILQDFTLQNLSAV